MGWLVGIGIAGLVAIAATLILRRFVASDVGSTERDHVDAADTLIVMIHGLAGAQSLTFLKKVVRERFSTADILTATYAPGIFSNIDPYRLANTIERGINQAHVERDYARIILVGHSMGAAVLRKAFVWAHGAEEDRAPRFGRQGHRSWADRTVRLVSLAGINRGWSLSPCPDNMRYYKFVLAHIGLLIARATGTAKMLLDLRQGSPFIADLRVQWIHIARQGTDESGNRRLPLTIHLLGDIDDVVSRADSQDLAVAKDTRFITLLNTGHAEIVTDLVTGRQSSERLKLIMDAMVLPEDKLPFDVLQVEQEDTRVERLIYILHGIRDYGTWADQLRKEIEATAPANVAVTPPKYGYFPMASFILFPDRQRNVRRFMDEYTENLARFPRAVVFDFIGHSNGTYILASALQRYATLRVRNVFFAGSVVPKHYPWRALVDSERVAKVRNVVATGDWVVALFPRFFEQIADWRQTRALTGYLDIGSAGFRGFEDSARADPLQRIADTKFVAGTHSAAFEIQDRKKLDAIVKFAIDGSDEGLAAFKNADEQWSLLDKLSNVSWLVWGVLALVLVALGYLALALGGGIGVAIYAIVLLALLFSV